MESFQSLFHQEWQHLHDPHVRALAWMLTSPDILAAHSPRWKHRLASLVITDRAKLHAWLAELERHPTALHEALALHKQRRLGHYAENLLGFYLRHEGVLYAHGLQVHADDFGTIGEFDFLLHQPDGLLHWEIASKFYLFDADSGADEAAAHGADLYDYLGPNLADTLGAKMQKIIGQQLALSLHPAAQKLVPQKIIAAQALIKGWLFYRTPGKVSHLADGIAAQHCRGYWWTLADVEHLAITSCLILERLQWLAPAQTRTDLVMQKGTLQAVLQRHFQHDSSPVMVAMMRKNGDLMQEYCRGMVVPDDWPLRAREKRQQGRLT